jgi:hypothetical protein|tara:strand:- start:44 stop:214 length:171 start_codon:yes stop_codon:yes gene_type:complete
MTERFWTPERKKDYYKLAEAREHRRKYIREYMKKERAKGTVKHWRTYRKEKNETTQ